MSQLFDETVSLYKKYVMGTYAPKVLFERGQGSYLWDADGRKYLDFATGISVCNLGHCHPKVTAAIAAQAQKLVHVSNLYYNEVTPRLAEKLITLGFDGVVFFANSGAEANEGMIKLARKWGSDKGKNHIISMEDSFHGRTLATLAATGRSKYRKGFSPDMPGFTQVPFNDFAALENAVTDKTCAIILEPVQGEGGIRPADQSYLEKVRALCDEKNILLLFDEVQCGMGRSGQFFAWQSYGVEPDALSMAKAIANGLPMGAMIVKRKLAGILTVGTHASTFGGTPLVSAAALAVLNTFEEEDILANCREMSKLLFAELNKLVAKYPCALEARGRGLLIGLALDREAAPLLPILAGKGLIALTAGETVLRLLPALNVGKEEVLKAVAIIDEALAELSEGKS